MRWLVLLLLVSAPLPAMAGWRWSGFQCVRHRPRPQRVALVPLGGNEDASITALILQLSRKLARGGRLTPVASPVSRETLRLEGRRIRPRNWRRARLRWVLKLGPTTKGSRGVELLLFDRGRTPRRLGPFAWQRTFDRKRRSISFTADAIADQLLGTLFGRRGLSATRIAYVKGRRKQSRVYVENLSGSERHLVSHPGHEGVLPSWSPHGALAFTSYLWRNPDLFVFRAGRASRISKRAGLNTGAAFAPDGRRIALTLSKDGNAELYLLDSRGGLLSRLTRHRRIDTSPSWSPDGRRLAFVSNRGGGPQIFVMAPGSTPRQLTTAGSYNQEPAWCPIKGCEWIAFTHRTDEGRYGVMLVHARSGALRAFGPSGARSPSWSPDGELLLYATRRGVFYRDRKQRCRPRRLLRGKVYTPRWSPFFKGR